MCVFVSRATCFQLRKHEWIEEFSKPVLEQHPTIAEGYLKVVSTPMDLGSVEQKLMSGAYPSQEALLADVNLVFDNAILYNSGEEEVSIVAKHPHTDRIPLSFVVHCVAVAG